LDNPKWQKKQTLQDVTVSFLPQSKSCGTVSGKRKCFAEAELETFFQVYFGDVLTKFQ
jgi:hypothetical protein